MINFVKNKISGKRLLILGFGREGESAYRFLRKHFPEIQITIADKNPQFIQKINDNNVSFISGDKYLDSLSEFDLILKSPGISLNELPYYLPIEKITSQTDIFLEFYSEQIIGITGTKGKSTTSSLIYHIIKLYTDDAVLVGNIGVPPFDMIEDISENTRIVFELSSHQLEFISKGPHTGILLNIFQEHLDYFKTFENYQQSKFNISRFQDDSDNFIFNTDDELIQKLLSVNKFERNYFEYSINKSVKQGCWIEKNAIYFSDGMTTSMILDMDTEIFLKGEHNVCNIMAASCACKLAGIPDEKINEGIRTFKGLEHRIEYVGEFKGIRFYNDSIATIPEATMQAIKTLKDVNTLILGGFDRGIDYDHLLEFLISSSVKNLILLGDAGKRMMVGFEKLNAGNKNILFVDTFEDAVKIAKLRTVTSGICLLSPAAASYDMFKNFEERGMVYKKLVRDI